MSVLPHTKKQWIAACVILVTALLLGTAIYGVISVWNAGYAKTEDSFFHSSFVTDRKVLVLVAHQDDDINLAYGVIDAFAQADGDVTVAFATNGDAGGSASVRIEEAVQADALMGVKKANIVLLGYGDHTVPPYFLSGLDLVRQSEAGYSQTYGAGGIADYHTLCFGEPAAYTRGNFEGDIRRLILNLRPDIIFVSDTDDNIDHVSVSQTFDRVAGEILRENDDYKPVIFKGFCYEYAWHGNEDFYHSLALMSAVPSWVETSYHTAYAWNDRVRFPLPNEYLGYTLRGSKLRDVLLAYASQNAVTHQNRLLNGDRVFWERRTDVCWADVAATSGNASLLQDFIVGDTREAPLANCWMPDSTDNQPEITFSWTEPQAVSELVFYDAPAPAGDILRVRVGDDHGSAADYTLPDGTGKPCRLYWTGAPVQSLTISILESAGEAIGFSEIEILPERDLTARWIHLTDADGNFIYEVAVPVDRAFTLSLYGYPAVSPKATASIVKDGSGENIAEIPLNEDAFYIPPLENGRYRIRAQSGDCSVEAVLRVGDSMFFERALRWIERKAGTILPN